MGDKGTANRERIIEAANTLFYQRGYNQTSFSDIAEASGLPRGNFYYYFKSKDDILAAVIAQRMDDIRAMLAEWEQAFPEPRARLKRFVQMLRNSAADVERYGCPIGSLNVELSKTQLQLQSQAGAMLELFRHWLTDQIAALGHPDANIKALHLVAAAQGISLVTNVYRDQAFLDREAAALDAWVDTL
jgi:AcrR family transcriptional regulator